MANRISTKIFIPHPAETDCSIVGVLEQLSEAKPCPGRRIALILHGAAGHKDYLFLKRLALRLPMDSFRFDFRGNHETAGIWKQGGLADDLEDLRTVVEFLKVHYGYVIDLVVGHSRGSIVSFRWICTSEEGANISGFVNASGRYRMKKLLEREDVKRWQQSMPTEGYHVWSPIVARKQVSFKIYPEDLATFANWDTSFVWDSFPASTDVLTIHGLSDNAVPSYDAIIYARALNERDPGTHSLHLMEDADHNFTGRQDEVVDIILEWWEKQKESTLKSGIWMSGIRGKL
ncbi:Alpha/Beta hydrolase protein [Lentinula detonsa]|uniref:Alpha/Beta hydrolase protein n=2 Tax=Lentinula TaxID=5352 RepID=A0AA38TZQ6_9AGAR|nr:Alpha/Beta hydrolase protein [Lentinula detonsa]KAJ3790154.1 Alpha/Beta hydrolase protein [Lentinula aff. detonsa]KAJ3801987.1 Alpha/Beta hydrolase protein [Lentinula aff. detonsa]